MQRTFLSVAFLLAFTPTLASAGEQTATDLMREGVRQRRAHDDAAALDLFRRADALAPSAETKAQIALAEEALGRWPLAAEHLEEALKSTTHPFIVKNKKALDKELSAILDHVTSIELLGLPSGTEVAINGADFEPWKPRYRLNEGTYRFQFRSSGYEPDVKEVTCAGGDLCRFEISLARAGTGAAAASRAVEVVHERVIVREQNRWARPVGLAGMGVGVLSIGVGVWQWRVRENAVADALQASTQIRGGKYCKPLFETPNTVCTDKVAAAKSAEKIEIVTLVAGGALLVGGAILYAAAPRTGEARTGFRCAPGLGSIACEGRF